MNKKFYFALALTAGLFASCSSDDLIAEAPGANFDADGDKAQITIGVDGINGYTRGTGSIMGKTWGGQQFEIFMFKKGTFDPATYKETETSPEVAIFNNDTLTTGKGDSKAAYIVSGTEKFNYFPSTGAYDFWAYRADDAGQAPVADVDTLKVPFEINGTQDLMIAITDTVKAATALLAAQPKLDNIDSAMTKIYSAYSARRGVNPKLKFSHLLTRLSFEVKAATREVSDTATLKTTDPNEKKGFKITKVTVWSKSKGKINVAYKCGIPADAERISWDPAEQWADTTTLADFQLMSRKSEIEKADIQMIMANKAEAGYAYAASLVNDGYTLAVADFADDKTCYTKADLDPNTGELIAANAMTFADARADATIGSIYVPAIKDGDHGDADATPWNLHIIKDDASAELIPLVPVVPKWEGYNPNAGWSKLTKEATSYTWTAVTRADLAAAPYNLAEDDIVALETNAKATAPTTATTGAVNDAYVFNNLGVYEYYGLTAIAYNTDVANAAPGGFNPETTGGNNGDIVYTGTLGVDEVYYKYHAAGGAVEEGKAVATPVGESMLVAPANDNGYWVEFTYTRTKKVTDTHVEPMVGTGLINVKTAAGKKFEAGKTYKVTAILYSDGQIDVENIMDTDGDGPVDEYDDNTADLDDEGKGYEVGE